jgi:hypothetical protein
MRDLPKYIYSRGGKQRGTVIGPTSRICFEGCRGTRIAVRWKGGKVTYPCSAGLVARWDGNLQIE